MTDDEFKNIARLFENQDHSLIIQLLKGMGYSLYDLLIKLYGEGYLRFKDQQPYFPELYAFGEYDNVINLWDDTSRREWRVGHRGGVSFKYHDVESKKETKRQAFMYFLELYENKYDDR